jgi:hypothetical protein
MAVEYRLNSQVANGKDSISNSLKPFFCILPTLLTAMLLIGTCASAAPGWRLPPRPPAAKPVSSKPKSASLSKLTTAPSKSLPVKAAPKQVASPASAPSKPTASARAKSPQPNATPTSRSLTALLKAQRGHRIDAHTIQYGPLMRGPLSEKKVASAFRSSTYTQHILQKDLVLYRQYGGKSDQLGKWWSRNPPRGPLNGKIENSLPSGNTASHVVKIRVPKGTVIYEGVVASHFGQIGGGHQVYLKKLPDPQWVIP